MIYPLFIGTSVLELTLLNRYQYVIYGPMIASRKATVIVYGTAGALLFISSVSFLPVAITGFLSLGTTFLVSLLYSGCWWSRLIFSLLYLILGFISESLSFFLLKVLHPMQSGAPLTEANIRLMVLFVSSLIMLFFILMIRRIKKERDYPVHNVYYRTLTAIIFISLLILNTLFFRPAQNVLYIVSVTGLLVINLLILFLFDKIIWTFRLSDENARLQKQMSYQEDSYVQTARSFEKIKQIIHDTNKQLLYIRACIQEDEHHEAIQHIEKTLDHMRDSHNSVATGNLVIDALVNNTLNMAAVHHIAIERDIRINAESISIDRFDLCIVLGNVLDNAIEAACQVQRSEDKYIRLHLMTRQNSLWIHIVNARPEPGNRKPKENPDMHGLGLTNIQRIAEKYGGYLTTDAKSSCFETTVLLPFASQDLHETQTHSEIRLT